MTEDQCKKLSRNMRLQELLVEDDDIPGFLRVDEEFHALLMYFTGILKLPDVIQTVSLPINRARMLLLPSPDRIIETLTEHKAILETNSNRDGQKAQDAMRHHLGQLMPRIEMLRQEKPELFNAAPQTVQEVG